MRKVFVLAIIIATVFTTAALADTLKKGENELSFSAGYTALKLEGEPNIKNYNFNGQWGYMLTDGNEVGITLGYIKYSTPPLQGYKDANGNTLSTSSSSQSYGVFYNYNFKAGDMANPFIGANISGLSGYLGDLANYTYGAQAGVKIYPWTNAGFVFMFAYDWYQGGSSDFGNSTDWFFRAGINVKF